MSVGENGALMPNTMDAQWRLACALSQPGILGPTYEGKPGAVLMSMNLAMERGKGPFSFLHSTYEVKGKITEWGADALGAVYSSGKAKELDFFFLTKEGKRIDELDVLTEPFAAVALGVRSDLPVRVIRYFTVDMARQANLLGNPKKETWNQYTRRMLETKAIGWMLKVAFPDVIAGIAMPEYEEHAPNDPGANAAATRPSTARERLLGGTTKEPEAQEGTQGRAVPGVRADSNGSVSRPDLEGDAERSPGEHDQPVQAASQPVRQDSVPVPARTPRRTAKAKGHGVEGVHGSV